MTKIRSNISSIVLALALLFLAVNLGNSLIMYARHAASALAFPYPLDYGEGPVPDPKVKWAPLPEIASDETMREKVDSGCRFYPRCPKHMDRCLTAQPPAYAINDHHRVACYLFESEKTTQR